MGHGRYIDPFLSREPDYKVAAGETLALQYVVLPGESRDITLGINLLGPGARFELKALYLSGARETVTFNLLVHHRAPGCTSEQVIKGVAGGESRVHFHGTIVVAPDAQGTDARQQNHNILLSEQAHVDTLPQLEIYADDVQCSHGATVGSLNADERFYMRSRGIPDAQARTLQLLSFLSPVIPQGREQEIEAALRGL